MKAELVPWDAIQPGDLVLFKGKGFLFNILSFMIGVFNKEWRVRIWKPWHTGFTAYYASLTHSWMICESLARGVTVNPLNDYPADSYRVYRWFQEPPDQAKILKFVSLKTKCKYDILVYLWTALKALGFPVPRIVNKRMTCWELVWELADDLGQEISDDYEYPMINILVKALGI